jgi:hypothetical protein
MTTSDFDNWFARPLGLLNADPHGGFAVLMIAIPLLERYLREKSRCFEGDLDDRFYSEFVKLFPDLNLDQAKNFWHSYRNGLLHRASFSKRNRRGTIMPQAWISSRTAMAPTTINYDLANDVFVLLPKEFSDRVLRVIHDDFSTFLGSGSTSHPLPEVNYPPSWPASTRTPGASDFSPPPSGTP